MLLVCKNCNKLSAEVKYAQHTDYVKCTECDAKFKMSDYFKLEAEMIRSDFVNIEFRNFKEDNKNKVILFFAGARRFLHKKDGIAHHIKSTRLEKYLYYHNYRLITIAPGDKVQHHLLPVQDYVALVKRILEKYELQEKDVVAIGHSNGGNQIMKLLRYFDFKHFCFSSPFIQQVDTEYLKQTDKSIVYFKCLKDEEVFNSHDKQFPNKSNIKVIKLNTGHSGYKAMEYLFTKII